MKKSFVLYTDCFETLKHLSDENLGKVTKLIFEYVIFGTEPDPSDLLFFVFNPIKVQIDRDSERYEKRAERSRSNGLSGGRPPKKNPENPVGYLETQKTQEVILKPRKPDSVSVSVSVSESVSVSGSDEKEKIINMASPIFLDKNSTQAEQGDKQAETGSRRPAKKRTFKTWKAIDLKAEIEPHVEEYGRDLCNEFYRYWSEPTASGKLRVNNEDAFEITRRLDTFRRNSQRFGPKNAQPVNQLKFKTKQEAEQFMIDKYFQGKWERSPKVYGIELVDEHNNPRNIDVISQEIDRAVRGGINA